MATFSPTNSLSVALCNYLCFSSLLHFTMHHPFIMLDINAPPISGNCFCETPPFSILERQKFKKKMLHYHISVKKIDTPSSPLEMCNELNLHHSIKSEGPNFMYIIYLHNITNKNRYKAHKIGLLTIEFQILNCIFL